MGKIVTIQKTITSEAIQINSPEEEAVVREWLAGMFSADLELPEAEATALAGLQDLSPLIADKLWFAVDQGSKIIYVIPDEEFRVAYETLGETSIEPEDSTDS